MTLSVVKPIGSLVRIKGTFKDLDDVLLDPTDVHLYIKDPNGVETTEEYSPGNIVRESAGVYYFDLDLDVEGEWIYRLYSTGTGQTALEGVITVTDLSTPATAEVIDIDSAALGPRRMKTDEGFVEEHKLTDLIMADQYSSQKAAPSVPGYGMRISKMKPKGAP